jgi:hypothetical protein
MSVRYKGYHIYYDPKPIPGKVHYSWVHDDYDGEDDPRCGYAADVADAKAQIDEQVAEGSE